MANKLAKSANRLLKRSAESWIDAFISERSIAQEWIHVGAMDGGVTAGCPASSDSKKRSMVRIADVNMPGGDIWPLCLRMATQAKVGVIVDQQLFVYGTVRVMANGATLPHGLVLKDDGPSLGFVTTRATFILPGHRQAARRLEDVTPVRIMTIHAIHEALNHRMMLRQIKFPLHVEMALETRGGVFPGIDNQVRCAAGPDMFTARSVAGLATTLARHGGTFDVQTGVRAGWEFADNIGMAIGAGLITHVVRARNLKRGYDRG
jgi:hypothetical protein